MVYRESSAMSLESFVGLVNSEEFNPVPSDENINFQSVRSYPDFVLKEAIRYEDDWRVRRAGCIALSERDCFLVEDALLDCLEDEDSDVIEAALFALKGRDNPRVVRKLEQAVIDDKIDVGIRIELVRSLVNTPGANVIVLLGRLLLDEEEALVREALEQLSGDNSTASTEALINSLSQIEDWEIRSAVVEHVSRRQHPQLFGALLQLIQNDGDDDVVKATIVAVASFGDIHQLGKVIDILVRAESEQLEPVLKRLIEDHSPESTALLRRFVDCDDWVIANDAVKEISLRRDQHVLPALEQALQNKDGDVVGSAIEGLKNLGQLLSLDRLVGLARDRSLDEECRVEFVEMIAQNKSDAATMVLAELVTDDEFGDVVDAATEELRNRVESLRRLYDEFRAQNR